MSDCAVKKLMYDEIILLNIQEEEEAVTHAVSVVSNLLRQIAAETLQSFFRRPGDIMGQIL